MEQYQKTEQEDANRVTATDHSIDGPTAFDTKAFFTEHLIRNETGGYDVKGDDLDPMQLALLEVEKRRRGSQASISKEKARADRSELELQKVREIIPTVQHVPAVDESLKYSDPDEYIKQTLEAARANPYDEAFNTASQQAADEAGQRTVEGEIAQFNADNPTTQITLEMLELDLPPRLLNEFAQGKLAPQDFLGQAATIMYSPTETHNVETLAQPDLGNVGGQTAPSDDGSNEALAQNYASAIF